MPKSGSELIFYGLLIAGFLLFNYVAQQSAKRVREQQERAAAEAAQAEAQPPVEDDANDIWGRRPQAAPAAPVMEAPPPHRAEPARAAPAAARRRAALFRTRQDLRHAVVVMTVLGPCRALEPHESR